MTWVATRTILRNGQRFEAGEPVDLGDDVAAQAELVRLGAIEKAADPTPAEPVVVEPATADQPVADDPAPTDPVAADDPAPVDAAPADDPAPAPKGRNRRA